MRIHMKFRYVSVPVPAPKQCSVNCDESGLSLLYSLHVIPSIVQWRRLVNAQTIIPQITVR
jgi:hypothetical protein